MKTIDVCDENLAITTLLERAREDDLLVKDAQGRMYWMVAIHEGLTPESIAQIQAPDDLKLRVGDLIWRQKTSGLSAEETSELKRYLQIEHLMRLAKARAWKTLAKE